MTMRDTHAKSLELKKVYLLMSFLAKAPSIPIYNPKPSKDSKVSKVQRLSPRMHTLDDLRRNIRERIMEISRVLQRTSCASLGLRLEMTWRT